MPRSVGGVAIDGAIPITGGIAVILVGRSIGIHRIAVGVVVGIGIGSRCYRCSE